MKHRFVILIAVAALVGCEATTKPRFHTEETIVRRFGGKTKVGMSGSMALTKTDRATGKVTQVIKGKNTILTAGEEAAAAAMADPGNDDVAWKSSNMQLRIYTSASQFETLDSDDTGLTVSSQAPLGDPGRLIIQWIDASSNTYSPDVTGGVRPVLRGSGAVLAEYMDILAWGSKVSGETWTITWTVTIDLAGGSSNSAWYDFSGYAICDRIRGFDTNEPDVFATNNILNPNFNLELTNIRESADGSTYTIMSGARRSVAGVHPLRRARELRHRYGAQTSRLAPHGTCHRRRLGNDHGHTLIRVRRQLARDDGRRESRRSGKHEKVTLSKAMS